MCGPSNQMENIESSTQSFGNTLQGAFGTRFGQQSQIFQDINSALSPIAEAGPNQQGFNAPTLAALNTTALDTTGANYANAARAENEKLSGRGGDSGLISGVDQQINAGLASQAAGALSGEQLGIQQANYAQGRQNFNTAVGGLNALAGEENPIGYANPAIQANDQAFNESNEINQQNNQKTADIVGAAVSIGAAPFTGGASLAGLSQDTASGAGSAAIPSEYTSSGGSDALSGSSGGWSDLEEGE